MKIKRFKFEYSKTASSLHRKVGDCIRSSETMKGYQIFQEYPVNKINPSFNSGREKFDWIINDLCIVIECHGEQHYRPSTFGGIGPYEARLRYIAQCQRDLEKKAAAVSAGWTYIVIPYTDEDKISEAYILDLIGRNHNNEKLVVTSTESTTDYKQLYKEKKQRDESSGRNAVTRNIAKEIRREQYQQRKKWIAKQKERDED